MSERCHVCSQPLIAGGNYCGQCGAAVQRRPAPPAAAAAAPAAGSPATAGVATGGGAHPAGWYPDYADASRLRYFDGTGWTQHVSRDGRTWTEISG